MKHIKDQGLIKSSSYVNGAWLARDNSFSVINPATLDQIAQVSDSDKAIAVQAVTSAKAAFSSWSSLSPQQRSQLLMAWFALIEAHQRDLSRLITLEQGKPLKEAQAEVLYGASYLEWFAEEGKRVYGDIISSNNASQRLLVSKQPVGVVTAITPWNFPHAMILRKAAAALAAGCSFVVKPSEETPLSALALAELAARAGIPSGVFNVVVGQDAKGIGEVLTQHPDVAKFSFTGSTETGKTLLTQCAQGVKKVSMELGGNAPFIVFADANIDAAVQGAIASKFRNAGQTCISSNRFYIAKEIAEEFSEKLIAALTQLTVGNGLVPSVNIGPLINQQAVAKVEQLVNSAINAGAELMFSSNTSKNLNPCFFPPTLLNKVTSTMEIAQQEIFGPVISLIQFTDENQVVEQANSSQHGLAAYLYSENISRIWRVADALAFGMVGINDHAISNAKAPFGGIKQSGSGREGSKYGLDDYLTMKYLCVGGLA